MQLYMNKGFPDYWECKEEILKEFVRIRHAYNNMMQTLACYIEEEDWEGLKEYKGTLFEKAQVLNRNNLTQLIRIKDKHLLVILYKLITDAKETGITINMTVCNDITKELSKPRFYIVLYDYLNHAYELAAKEAKVIELKIYAEDGGLGFYFKNFLSSMPGISDERTTVDIKDKKVSKNIFTSTFLSDEHRTQEIIFCFND